MPPPSTIILRQNLDRRLTSSEIDNNFLAVGAIPRFEIPFGHQGNLGLTSSSNFAFNYRHNLSILGGDYNKGGSAYCSTIIGGYCNSLYGGTNTINNSSILGGYHNYICYAVTNSSIIGGRKNLINDYVCDSVILGGYNNTIRSRDGLYRCLEGTTIIGGNNNSIYCYSSLASIIGGSFNKIEYGGDSNIIATFCSQIYKSCNSTIIDSYCSKLMYGNSSIIIGGHYSYLCESSYSSIIGGCNTCIYNSNYSAVIGGCKLVLSNMNNTILMPSILTPAPISGSSSGTTQSWMFGGTVSTGSVTLNPREYVEVSIGGTVLRLGLVH